MVNSRRIVAVLACLSIPGVSASPCRPATTTGTASVSATSESLASASTSTLASVTGTSTSILSSETEPATSETGASSDSQSATATGSTTSDTLSTTSEAASTTTDASTTDFTSTATETTTTAAATTTSASCNNEIYRGLTRSQNYRGVDSSTEQECYEACFNDEMCNAWWFEDVGACSLYTEELSEFGTPTNERDNLMGSRNCSPDDYTPCNDEIGFGYIAQSPFGQTGLVRLEADCAHLCMKNGRCTVWQYDSSTETCNMFDGSFADLFAAEAPQGGRVMLAGSRSCSSDFFRPQLGSCNGQMDWNAGPAALAYRTFPEYNTIGLCARACSIDPLCLSWLIWNGDSDCEFYLYPYGDAVHPGEDICTAGSRNCGVP